eukprot:1161825-Pelagomonas_calceolata.AAC.10
MSFKKIEKRRGERGILLLHQLAAQTLLRPPPVKLIHLHGTNFEGWKQGDVAFDSGANVSTTCPLELSHRPAANPE